MTIGPCPVTYNGEVVTYNGEIVTYGLCDDGVIIDPEPGHPGGPSSGGSGGGPGKGKSSGGRGGRGIKYPLIPPPGIIEELIEAIKDGDLDEAVEIAADAGILPKNTVYQHTAAEHVEHLQTIIAYLDREMDEEDDAILAMLGRKQWQ